MTIIAILNLVGLVLTVAAAFLMWYFPPRTAYYTEDGAQVVQWTNNPKPEKARIGWLQARRSEWAPFVLGVGFALQLPSAVLSVWQATKGS